MRLESLNKFIRDTFNTHFKQTDPSHQDVVNPSHQDVVNPSGLNYEHLIFTSNAEVGGRDD